MRSYLTMIFLLFFGTWVHRICLSELPFFQFLKGTKENAYELDIIYSIIYSKVNK